MSYWDSGVDCQSLVFSGHAIQQMFFHRIGKIDVESVIAYGEIIEEYLDDAPFPCCLLLEFVRGTPIHVILSQDHNTGTCYVVTVYVPTHELWQNNFRTRR